MTKNEITREMTIEEIFSTFPQKSQMLGQEMTNAGLHCVGCGAATWETLETGMLSHGFEMREIDALLQRLNGILAQEFDTTTITMTPRAAKQFLNILKEDGKENWALRFGVRAGGCSGFEYQLDFSEAPKQTDRVYNTAEGVTIHVDENDADLLNGCHIDWADGLQGAGFKISNPNAKGSCGCGKSQSY